MNVYIHKPVNYSDMQGPAPSGFHVPLTTEWKGLKTIMNLLGLTTENDWRINLHIPFAGARRFDAGDTANQGSSALYWSSSPAFDYPGRAFSIYLTSSYVNANDKANRTYGYSVRCFKNGFELPTASWTVIAGTLGSAGIFRNQTEGLISITSDGTTGYTIQDKNLGATTVYSDGATLSQANCGKYYQWGNNYGFARTGSVTTSSTKVDASAYGPGNYYSGSTFILGNPFGGQDWSSVQNDNLRGGVTGVGGESELKNAYIGEAPYKGDELCFTANTANSTVQLTKTGSPTDVTLETSTDGSTWTTYTIGDTITLSNIGDKVYLRNTSETDTGFNTSTVNRYKFVMTGSISASGDINYLLNKNSTTTVSDYCFYYLFGNCTSLTTPPELPATTLAQYCYCDIFNGCTSLTTAPSLPVTTLAGRCYANMFFGCTGLTTAPSLPATTLDDFCYSSMFYNCKSLTTAPQLPATTLAERCYNNMFKYCTGLTVAPSLPATTLADYCYYGMFNGCSKIKLSTTQTGEYQTSYRIPKTGTGTTATDALYDMFASTGGTFTGAPSINTTYYTSNTVV